MRNRTFLTAVLALFLASLPMRGVADPMVLHASGYVDVRAGEIVRPAVIVVDGERIAAVNPAAAPDDARVLDLGEQILLPGLMDMHTHLAFDNTTPGWPTIATRMTPAEFALFGADAARRVLMAGFTTARDVSSWRHMPDVALMHGIERGWVIGPRLIPAGHALSITGGHCDITGLNPDVLEGDPRYGIADGVEEVMKAVRWQIKHGVKVIKICATAGVASLEGSAAALQYTEAEIRAAVEETHRHELTIAAHAHGTEGILAATRAGVDSIEHGSMLTAEAARLMKRNGTYLVPTIYLQDKPRPPDPPGIAEKRAYLAEFTEESFRLAVREGVKLALGSDLDAVNSGDNAKEFYAMVRRGLPADEAIRSATVNAAELLGVDDRGEIRVGLLADLIAVEGNPLDDVRVLEDVRFVMKGGDVVKRDGRPVQ